MRRRGILCAEAQRRDETNLDDGILDHLCFPWLAHVPRGRGGGVRRLTLVGAMGGRAGFLGRRSGLGSSLGSHF